MEHHAVLADDARAAEEAKQQDVWVPTPAPRGEAGLASIDLQPLTGVVTDLGTLPPEAVITETALSAMFGRHPCSIKRAVQRGELPTPCRLFGKNVWTAAALSRHLEERQTAAARERQVIERRLAGLKP